MSSKEVRVILRELEGSWGRNQGIEVIKNPRTSHYTIRKDGVRVATMALSPSCHYALKNFRQDMKRAGYEWRK
jgi:hypothetical protein